jgi:hypothetical protein
LGVTQGGRVEGVLYAWVRVTRREPVPVGAAKPASSVSRSRQLNENGTSGKAAQIGTIREAEQRWSLVYAVVPPGTLIYAEKVRPQLLSLRHVLRAGAMRHLTTAAADMTPVDRRIKLS